MDTTFTCEWNASRENMVANWCRDKLAALDSESVPDEQLVTYIAVMVGNKKSVSDIHNELKEFIDEELSRYISYINYLLLLFTHISSINSTNIFIRY